MGILMHKGDAYGGGGGDGTSLSYTDVVDNLTSTASKMPLSANSGRLLNEKTIHIVSFDAATGTLVTKSWDYEG